MGWIGVILLGILIWVAGSSERRYQKEMMEVHNAYNAGQITLEQYIAMSNEVLFKRHKL